MTYLKQEHIYAFDDFVTREQVSDEASKAL